MHYKSHARWLEGSFEMGGRELGELKFIQSFGFEKCLSAVE